MDYKNNKNDYDNNIINKNTDDDYVPESCSYCGYINRNSSSWQRCRICPIKKNHVNKYIVKF